MPLVKIASQINNFLISQPNHMLWVLKRTVSMRRSFKRQKHMLKVMGKKNIYYFKLNRFVYLILWKPASWVVKLGTNAKLYLRNFVSKSHPGHVVVVSRPKNSINKGKCHFQICFIFTL